MSKVGDVGRAMMLCGKTADDLGVTPQEMAELLSRLADRGLVPSLAGAAIRRALAGVPTDL